MFYIGTCCLFALWGRLLCVMLWEIFLGPTHLLMLIEEFLVAAKYIVHLSLIILVSYYNPWLLKYYVPVYVRQSSGMSRMSGILILRYIQL